MTSEEQACVDAVTAKLVGGVVPGMRFRHGSRKFVVTHFFVVSEGERWWECRPLYTYTALWPFPESEILENLVA